MLSALSLALAREATRREASIFGTTLTNPASPVAQPTEELPVVVVVAQMAASVLERAQQARPGIAALVGEDAAAMGAVWVGAKFHGTSLTLDVAVSAMMAARDAASADSGDGVVDARSMARLDFMVEQVAAAEAALLDAVSYILV
jgi:hypothetical protein